MNLGLPHCRQTLYSLSHWGSPTATVDSTNPDVHSFLTLTPVPIEYSPNECFVVIQYLVILTKLWWNHKISPPSWEGLGAGGEGDDRI